MRILPLLSLALFSAAPVIARADLTMVQRVQQEGPDPVDTVVTLKVKGEQVRVDPSPQVTAIIDTKTGDTTTIMHAQKMVTTIPGSVVKGLQQQTQEKFGDGEATPAQSTGNKQTVGGYACEEYLFSPKKGMTLHIWATQDIPDADKIMAELEELSADLDPYRGLLKQANIPGFPVQVVIDGAEGAKASVTLVALSQNPLPDTDFEIPKGYKQMALPNIGR